MGSQIRETRCKDVKLAKILIKVSNLIYFRLNISKLKQVSKIIKKYTFLAKQYETSIGSRLYPKTLRGKYL